VGAGVDHVPFTTFRTLSKIPIFCNQLFKTPSHQSRINQTHHGYIIIINNNNLSAFLFLFTQQQATPSTPSIHSISATVSSLQGTKKTQSFFFYFLLIQQCKKLIDFYDYSHGLLWVLKDIIMKHRLQLQISKQVVRIITIQLLRNIRELVIQ